MKRFPLGILLALFLFLSALWCWAADMAEVETNYSASDVTLVTTAETSVISCPAVSVPFQTARVIVKGWGIVTTGTDTTTLTVRVRRGTTATGTNLSAADATTIYSAAGSTQMVEVYVVDTVANANKVQYNWTIEQAGASANGTVLQAWIECDVING